MNADIVSGSRFVHTAQTGALVGAVPAVATVPPTLDAFMAQALAMEREAVERYTEFADAMETHNNLEVASMFRTMAGYESKHAAHIMHDMGWTEAPPTSAASQAWTGFDAPEAAPIDAVHYLMQPWHALQLALAAEQRAEAFFGTLAAAASTDAIRQAALQLQAEESEHVALVRSWMDKVPQPDSDWALDPDPPRYTE
ncbi:MAG: ferritin family protein [Burkholderiaceae bacterium]